MVLKKERWGEGLSALVSGGGRGIGAAIAVALAERGFQIWLNYREDHKSAGQVRKSIEQLGGECRLLPFDVADQKSVETSLSELLAETTPFALINNAGLTRDGLLGLMMEEDWNRVMEVNLGGMLS